MEKIFEGGVVRLVDLTGTRLHTRLKHAGVKVAGRCLEAWLMPPARKATRNQASAWLNLPPPVTIYLPEDDGFKKALNIYRLLLKVEDNITRRSGHGGSGDTGSLTFTGRAMKMPPGRTQTERMPG